MKGDVFGIRAIEINGGQFILNGEPVRLVGMTGHADFPEFSLAEPVSFIAADYDDMKRLNVVFSRPVHYAQDEAVLDYSDRNGILLIPKLPAWQIEASHLRNQSTLEAARLQLSEMILGSCNHPSIWAWGVGNEIDSSTLMECDYSPISEALASASETDGILHIELKTHGPLEENMPVCMLREYQLHWEVTSRAVGQILSEGIVDLPTLTPAETWVGMPETPPLRDGSVITLKVVRPTGFSVWEQTFESFENDAP